MVAQLVDATSGGVAFQKAKSGAAYVTLVDTSGNPYNASSGGGTVTSRSVVSSSYLVTIAISGGSVGDIITATQLLDTATTPPSVLSTSWFNVTKNTAIASSPTLTSISSVGDAIINTTTTNTILTSLTASGTVAVGARFIRFVPATGMVLTVDNYTFTASSIEPSYTKQAQGRSFYSVVPWSVTGTIGQVLKITTER